MLHNTILKYIAAIKAFFNDLSVTHTDDRGRHITKNIPIIYGRQEKAIISQNYSEQQTLQGNTKILPIGYISLEAFSKADDRMTNKNRALPQKEEENGEVKRSYNSVPYDFIFNINIRCRGAVEAYQIVEQLAPMFNPTVNLDIWDSMYEPAPTRIPVTLDGIDVTAPDYEENSNNVYEVSVSCTLRGWLYQPLFSGTVINNTIINTNLGESTYASLTNGEFISNQEPLKLHIIDIIRKGKILTAITDYDPRLVVTYEWDAFGGDINPDGNTCTLNVNSDYNIELTLRDQFGNFTAMTKHFNKLKYVDPEPVRSTQ